MLALVTITLLALVLIPTLVPLLPSVVFDVDPRSNEASVPVIGLGPVGLVIWSNLVMLASTLAVVASVVAGGRLHWRASLLLLPALVVAMIHGSHSVPDTIAMQAVIAGLAVLIGALHLAEHETSRRLIVAGLIACLIAMAIDALVYVLIEHPMTVERFKETEQQLLDARGWEVGSPAHQLYVRRLAGSDAIGAYGLSNVFAGVLAVINLLALGVTAHAVRRRAWGLAVSAGGSLVAGGIALMLTRSKGGVAVLAIGVVIGVALIGLGVLNKRIGKRRLAGTLAVIMGLGAWAVPIGVVLVRGWLGPPQDWTGERSLLFRCHYLWAGVRIWLADTWTMIAGMPATVMQQAYLSAKHPLSPEDVTSLHNAVGDWAITLGIAGVLAMATVIVIALRGLTRCCVGDDSCVADEHATNDQPATDATPNDQPLLTGVPNRLLAGVVTLLLFVAVGMTQYPMWQELSLAMFVISAAAFAVVMTSVLNHARLLSGRFVHIAAATASIIVLIHSQIEMTLHFAASAGLLLLVVGLAGGVWRSRTNAHQPGHGSLGAARKIAIAAALVVGIALTGQHLVTHARPIARQQAAAWQAASELRQGDVPAALVSMDAAGAIRYDPSVWRYQLILRMEAASRLALADGAGQTMRKSRAMALIDQALALAHQSVGQGHDSASTRRMIASIHQLAFRISSDPHDQQASIEALKQVVARAPHNPHDRLALADALWPVDPQVAADAYASAVQVSDQQYLDPARQLAASELDRARRRAATQP